MSERVKSLNLALSPKISPVICAWCARFCGSAWCENELHFRCETRHYLDLSGFLTDSLQAIFTLLGGIWFRTQVRTLLCLVCYFMNSVCCWKVFLALFTKRWDVILMLGVKVSDSAFVMALLCLSYCLRDMTGVGCFCWQTCRMYQISRLYFCWNLADPCNP